MTAAKFLGKRDIPMSQDSPPDQPAEDHPGIEAAYARSQKHDNVGMRALASLFLLEHEFRRVPRSATFGEACGQSVEPLCPL